jgi:hypothetical protein
VIGPQAGEDFILIADLPVGAIRECGNSVAAEGAPPSRTSCSGLLTGSIFNNTASISLKIAVLAPMPNASVIAPRK